MSLTNPINLINLINAKSFGELIKTIRKESNLTQEQLAAASGVGVRFLRELEQGKPSCQLEKALHIARMLGIKLEAQSPAILKINNKNNNKK